MFNKVLEHNEARRSPIVSGAGYSGEGEYIAFSPILDQSGKVTQHLNRRCLLLPMGSH
jgi:hypothetical protein